MNGTPVHKVAMSQEFGSAKRNIPKRSFLKSTAKVKKSEVTKKLKDLSKKVLAGADVSKENNKIGAWFASEVKQTIKAGGYPMIPNKANTVKAKGGNNTPLVHTGLLMKSITWQEK